MELFEYIGAQIRDLRVARRLSQEQLGREMGVPTNTISRWETATYRPDVEALDKLARFLGVSILQFFPPTERTTDERLSALLRTAKELHPDDLEELRKYADYRRARNVVAHSAKPVRKKKAPPS